MIFRLDETDLVLLYSAKPLRHKQYPSPAKFSTALPEDYSQSQISLIAYNGDPSFSTFKDYPDTPREALEAAFDGLMPNRLSFTTAMTGLRHAEGLIYHRCSSLVGASGGRRVSENGDLVGC